MAQSRFETSEWHATVGALVAADTDAEIADRLFDAIGQVVVHNGCALLAFHQDAPPEVLRHTLEPEEENGSWSPVVASDSIGVDGRGIMTERVRG